MCVYGDIYIYKIYVCVCGYIYIYIYIYIYMQSPCATNHVVSSTCAFFYFFYFTIHSTRSYFDVLCYKNSF